ncbi:MAG: hypothetical protein ACTSSL_08605 [Candidatus Heimdallarchaeaceae archaeon]
MELTILSIFLLLIMSGVIAYPGHTLSKIKNLEELEVTSDQTPLVFRILSPTNGHTYYNKVKISYFLDPIDANVTFWLNDTLLSVSNNSYLSLSFRGVYNLTGITSYKDYNVSQTVFFVFLVPLNTKFKLTNLPPYPIYGSNKNIIYYVFAPNDTISLLVNFSEFNKNIPIELQILNLTRVESSKTLYKRTYERFTLTSANYTWLNQSTINLLIEPIFTNYTLPPIVDENEPRYYSPDSPLWDGYSYYSIMFQMWSSINSDYLNSTYYFGRDYYSPVVQILDTYSFSGFLSEPQKGVVYPHIAIFDSSDILLNKTVILLDSQKIADGEDFYRIVNGDYRIDLLLDTTLYTNGQHNLTILTSDIYHHSTVLSKHFLLLFIILLKQLTLLSKRLALLTFLLLEYFLL